MRLIGTVKAELVARTKQTPDEARAMVVTRLELVAARMRQLPDLRGELMALKALAVVLGVAKDREDEDDDFGRIVRRIGSEQPTVEQRAARLLPPPTVHAAAGPKGARGPVVSTHTADGVPLNNFEHMD